MNSKKCTKCGEEKLLTEFSRHNMMHDGRRPDCKSCGSKASKIYREKNPELIKQQKKEHREKNLDKIRQKDREKYWKDPEKHKSDRRKRYYKDPERFRQENKERYHKDPSIREASVSNARKRRAKEDACIYLIKNLITGRIYVGETLMVKTRLGNHLTMLKKGSHENNNIQKDLGKYGAKSFQFEVYKTIEDGNKKMLLKEEAKAIQRFIAEGKELYNLALTIEQLKMLLEDK